MAEKAAIGVAIIGAIIGLAGVAYGLSKTGPPMSHSMYMTTPEFEKAQSPGLFLPQYDKW